MNETRIKHLDALIAEVGGALRYQSIQYHLFGDDQKVSVLENTCPEIWHAIQDGLFDATVAAVGRLCDKDGNPGKGNITVYAVAKELDSSGNLQKRVYESLKPTTKLRKNLIRFRHKTVAHADAATRLGHSVEGSGFRLSEIDDVIKSMMAAVDILIDYAGESEYPWQHFGEVRIDPFFETLIEGQKIVGEIPA